MKKLLATALILLGVTACVGPMVPIRDAENEQAGLVYGYINGTSGVPNVTLYNKEARVLAPWAPGNVPAHTYGNGLIVFDNVAPGEYYIHGFGVGQTAYSLGEHRIKVKVRPGEIKYLGAYVYAQSGNFFSSEFSFEATDQPSHQTVLQWAIEATSNTDWSQRLMERSGRS